MGSLWDAAVLVGPSTATAPLCPRHCPSPGRLPRVQILARMPWAGTSVSATLPCPSLRVDRVGGTWSLLLVQPPDRNRTVGSRSQNPSSFTGRTEAWLDLPKRSLLVLLVDALGRGAAALRDAVCQRVFKSDGTKYFPARGRSAAPAASPLLREFTQGWGSPLLRPVPGSMGRGLGARQGPCVSVPAPHHQHRAEQVSPAFPSRSGHFLGGFLHD